MLFVEVSLISIPTQINAATEHKGSELSALPTAQYGMHNVILQHITSAAVCLLSTIVLSVFENKTLLNLLGPSA